MNRSTQHAFESEEIMAYLDGELEAQGAAALASHLEHCTECQAVTAQLRQISERLLDFQVEPFHGKDAETILTATEQPDMEVKKTALELRPRWRRRLRILAWAFVPTIVLLLILAIAIPNYLRTRMAANESKGVSVDYAVIPVAPAKPAPSHGRSVTEFQTLAPGAAADSNGNFRGSDDKSAYAFSLGGGGGAQGGTRGEVEMGKQGIEAPKIHGPMIVQIASITILAQNYEEANSRLQPLTAAHGGYVQDMTAESRTGTARSVSATLRVPEKQLELFLTDLRKLGHVEQETRNNQEVTDAYIDLNARLKTARATEQRILQLLGTRTGKLSDVLEAEQELERVRGEIESMDGQRANMEHQVDYATVQVQLNEEYREQLNPESFSTGRRLRNSLVEGLGNLTGGITALALFVFAYGPSMVFWLGLLAVPAWFIWRRMGETSEKA